MGEARGVCGGMNEGKGLTQLQTVNSLWAIAVLNISDSQIHLPGRQGDICHARI